MSVLAVCLGVFLLAEERESAVVQLIPMGPVPASHLRAVEKKVESQLKMEVIICREESLPKVAYSPARKRYRADKILKELRKRRPGTYRLAVTTRDICTLNKQGKEWGIFGLGYMPGYQAVISSYRLGKRGKVSRVERLARVAVHELGQNLGLPHCPKACVMSDAEGAIRSLDDWPDFCRPCAEKLGF